jgi:hypothetical protein
MFIDGTFSVLEEDLTLTTTIIYSIDDIGIPVAWLIHEEKNWEVYEHFFNELQKLTCLQMKPRAVFADYDPSVIDSVVERIGKETIITELSSG